MERDGYGCCYNPAQPDSIVFSVASYHSGVDTASDMFAQSLESSLLQMRELCRGGQDQVNNGPADTSSRGAGENARS